MICLPASFSSNRQCHWKWLAQPLSRTMGQHAETGTARLLGRGKVSDQHLATLSLSLPIADEENTSASAGPSNFTSPFGYQAQGVLSRSFELATNSAAGWRTGRRHSARTPACRSSPEKRPAGAVAWQDDIAIATCRHGHDREIDTGNPSRRVHPTRDKQPR